jgi:hypothetical protein
MTREPMTETTRKARTLTPNRVEVWIYVSAIEKETDTGWFVYGYRLRAQGRRTNRPVRYFIAK